MDVHMKARVGRSLEAVDFDSVAPEKADTRKDHR